MRDPTVTATKVEIPMEFWLQFPDPRESDQMDEDGSSSSNGKRQLKLSNVGITSSKRKSEEIESSGKGRCKFFQARKLEQLTHF
nr:ribonuclease h2 subunit a [Quercus suber]